MSSSQESAPPTQSPVSGPPPTARRQRRGISPLTWFLLIVLILVPLGFWVSTRSGDVRGVVAVTTRKIPPYTKLEEGDLNIVERSLAPGQQPIPLSVGNFLTIVELRAGEPVLMEDVLPLNAAELPTDVVAVALPMSASVPAAGMAPGDQVVVHLLDVEPTAAVNGVVLSAPMLEQRLPTVVALSRTEAAAHAAALQSGKVLVVKLLDIGR